MSTHRKFLVAFVAATFATLGSVSAGLAEAFDPPGILLTWQQDPTTTMTIDWQSEKADERGNLLQYREVDASEWQDAEAEVFPFPFTDRLVHRVELTGLEPATTYAFRCGEDGREFRFRTMPADLTKPVHIAVGGDTRHRQEWMEATNRAAMAYNPEFMIWGGDFSYADGREDRAYRWFEWFDAIKNTMIDEDGRIVPVVGCIGNHEIQQGTFRVHFDFTFDDAGRERIAPYFYTLFAFPGQPGYNVLDFGDYLSLVILDSDHSNTVDSQNEWLEETLAARQHVRNLFPVYHIPAYPSHRSYDGTVSQFVRAHWVPLFEQYGVEIAFENHDHTYKRTHPIRDGKVDETGIVYLGDGAWGVSTRSVPDPEDVWYLARAESKRHAIIMTLQGQHRSFVVVDEDGEVIDTYPERALEE